MKKPHVSPPQKPRTRSSKRKKVTATKSEPKRTKVRVKGTFQPEAVIEVSNEQMPSKFLVNQILFLTL